MAFKLAQNDSSDQLVFWPSMCGKETFWNSTGAWQTFHPTLSYCVQNTLLTWFPCFLLWLLAPFYLYSIYQNNHEEAELCRPLRRSILNIIKLVLGVFLSLLPLAEIIVVAVKGSSELVLSYMLAAAIKLITMVLVTVLLAVEFRHAVYTSGLMFIFWLIYAIFQTVRLYAFSHLSYYGDDAVNNIPLEKTLLGVHVTSYLLILFQLIASCIVDRDILNRTVGPVENARSLHVRVNDHDDEESPLLRTHPNMVISPMLSANFLSKVLFAWVVPVLYRGYFNGHTPESLPEILPSESSSKLLPKFNKHIDNNQDNRKKMSSKYLTALLKTVIFRIVISGVMRLLTILLLFANLIVFRYLILFVKNRGIYTWQGFLFACLLFFITLIRGFLVTQWLYWCDIVGMHLRTLITTTIYRKVLKLSVACTAQHMGIGFIVNLMSVDSLKLSQSIRSLHELVTLPIYLALATYFLFLQLSWAALIGMCVMVFVVPLTTFLIARKTRNLQDRQMDAKDLRLKMMNEILSGIKVLKLYAWEPFFEKKVMDVRNTEINCMTRAALLNVVGNIICILAPYIVSLIMFGSYMYLSTVNELEPGIAFVALSLICLLNYNISTIPSSINYIIQGIVCIRRASDLMDLEEVEPEVEHVISPPSGPAVEILHGTFSWGNAAPALHEINLKIARGKLVAVVGSVGSGKSSLLNCILHEMKTVDGSLFSEENVGYSPQQAWIQNGTLQDNITFGKPYNSRRYRKVIEACALTEDLKILAGGDQTELGGKGVNLSGGQKQRVSLARAVYWDAELYLIDDSLSAVDPNVGRHIFQHAIGPRGLLRKKTRIFATNSLSFLPEVDQIILMKDGRIDDIGTYGELKAKSQEFRMMIGDLAENVTSSAVCRPTTNRGQSTAPAQISPVEELRRAWSLTERTTTNRLESYSSMLSFVYGDDIEENFGRQSEKSKLSSKESARQGFIGWKVVGECIKSGSLTMFFLVLFGHGLFIATQAASSIWLQIWTDETFNDPHGNSTLWYSSNGVKLGMYGGIIGVEVIAVIIDCLALATGFIIASRTLHSAALKCLFRAPMSFFDTTPLGRILNYFSTDMDTVDVALPLDVQLWLISIGSLVSTIITIGVADPVFLSIVIPILVINIIVQRIYGSNAIPLKRLYALSKSPIYSHFEETINGAPSIRAYHKQTDFVAKCDRLTDTSQKPWHQYCVCWRWYTSYNETIGAVTVFLTAMAAVALQAKSGDLSPGQVGLALFSVFQVLPHIPIASRMMVEIEANVVAVERIKEYSIIKPEAPWKIEGTTPNETWPQTGTIECKSYSTQYRADLPMVLDNLSYNIQGGEKIGIVGRTGAGKSSIVLSLFRLLEASKGSIEIDGVNISHIGLHDLRSNMTTIPQDPVLFSGSLRSNVDPSGTYADEEILTALEHAHLSDFLSARDGLDSFVSNGDELSVGERQLLCLARALLRKSKIIILDEATAGVDVRMDELIQETIRTQFTDSTVITIAHRLHTIMDCDRVMVFDKGQLAECGAPKKLLAKKDSQFSAMAKHVQLNKPAPDDEPTTSAAKLASVVELVNIVADDDPNSSDS